MFGMPRTADSVASELIDGLESGAVVLHRNDSSPIPSRTARRHSIARRFKLLALILAIATLAYALATVGIVRREFNGKPATAIFFPDYVAIAVIVSGTGASFVASHFATKFKLAAT